jgi:integrase
MPFKRKLCQATPLRPRRPSCTSPQRSFRVGRALYTEAHYIAITKNGDPRDIDLNEEAVRLLKDLTPGLGVKHNVSLRANGKTWKYSEHSRPTNAAFEAAAIQSVTFHVLRHTYASHAAMNGMPIAKCWRQLGLKDTRITTRHYAHLSPNYKQRIVKATRLQLASRLPLSHQRSRRSLP